MGVVAGELKRDIIAPSHYNSETFNQQLTKTIFPNGPQSRNNEHETSNFFSDKLL